MPSVAQAVSRRPRVSVTAGGSSSHASQFLPAKLAIRRFLLDSGHCHDARPPAPGMMRGRAVWWLGWHAASLSSYKACQLLLPWAYELEILSPTHQIDLNFATIANTHHHFPVGIAFVASDSTRHQHGSRKQPRSHRALAHPHGDQRPRLDLGRHRHGYPVVPHLDQRRWSR